MSDCSSWITSLGKSMVELALAQATAQEILATRMEELTDEEVTTLWRISSEQRHSVAREIYVILTIGWRRLLLQSRMKENLDSIECLEACFGSPEASKASKATYVWSQGFSQQEKEIFQLFERMFKPLVSAGSLEDAEVIGDAPDEGELREGTEEWLQKVQVDVEDLKILLEEYDTKSKSIPPSSPVQLDMNLDTNLEEHDTETPSPPEVVINEPVQSTSKLLPPVTKKSKLKSPTPEPTSLAAEPIGRITRSRSRSPGLLPPVSTKRTRTKSPSLPPPVIQITTLSSSSETVESSSLEKLNQAPKPSQRPPRNISPLLNPSPFSLPIPIDSSPFPSSSREPMESQCGPTMGISSKISEKLKRQAKRQSIKLRAARRSSAGPREEEEEEVPRERESRRESRGLKPTESEILMPAPPIKPAPVKEVTPSLFSDIMELDGAEAIQLAQDTQDIFTFTNESNLF